MLDSGGCGMYAPYMQPIRTIPSHELRQNLRDALDYVQRGGRVVVTRNGREVAVMAPPDSPRQTDTLGPDLERLTSTGTMTRAARDKREALEGLGPGWSWESIPGGGGTITKIAGPGGVVIRDRADDRPPKWWASAVVDDVEISHDGARATPQDALAALLALGRAAMPSEAHRAVFDELTAIRAARGPSSATGECLDVGPADAELVP